jgi:hypothetical protein
VATEQEKLNFYIPPAEAKEFRRVAEEQNRTISALLRQAVRRIIAEHKASSPPV